MSATTHGGDVVMRPVARKGCSSEESGACCPCPQFVLGGKEIRFVCANCGHVEAEHAPCARKQYQFPIEQLDRRCGECGLYPSAHAEAEHAPCARKQYQFPIEQLDRRCGECGLYPSAHAEAEHAPCLLTKEDLLPHLPSLPSGRCSGCGLGVGRHLRDPVVNPPARRMRVSPDPDSMYLMSFSVPNGTSLLHFRTHAFRIAAECHAFRRDDEGRGNCITYTGEVLPYALSFELYFESKDQALEFIRRIYECLPSNHEVPASVPEAVIVSRPPCLKQLLSRDHEISAKRTPRDVGPQSPLADHVTHGSPSDGFSDEDIEFEALQTRKYFWAYAMKPEGCHIVAKRDRKPHNRLIMSRTLHSYFDGTPQMVPQRHPLLFVSLGEGDAQVHPSVSGRVFVPIRLYFLPVISMEAVLNETQHLVPHRRIGAEDCFRSRRIDDSTYELWVGFLDGGKSPEEVRRAVGAALATRLRPDQVAPAPYTALELDQSQLTDDEGDEAMG